MLAKDIRTAIGFRRQVGLHVPLTAADVWSLRRQSTDVPQPVLNFEDDREDQGVGVFPTQIYKTNWSAQWSENGRLTSEIAAVLATFGLGSVSKAAAGSGFKYTCTPFTSGEGEMPSTTYLAAGTEQGANAVVDIAMVGVCVEEFGFSFRSGVGRDTATWSATLIGSGKHSKPSGIVMPSFATEHNLSVGGASISIHSREYVNNRRFVSSDFRYKNNIKTNSAYFPGSGSQSGAALAGRMRRGIPDISFNCQVLAKRGSSEVDDMLALTEGTAVIDVPGATIGAGPDKHGIKITLHRVPFRAAPYEQDDENVTINIETLPLLHSTNGIVTIEVTCEQNNVFSIDSAAKTFTADNTTDTLTSTAHGFVNGDRVMLASEGVMPDGLEENVSYYVINSAANTFQVSITSGGAAENFTTNGTGTHKAAKIS